MSKEKTLEYYIMLPYTLEMHKDEEGGELVYVAVYPQLGCMACGKTIDEAYKEIAKEKKRFLRDALKNGDEIPDIGLVSLLADAQEQQVTKTKIVHRYFSDETTAVC